MKDIKTERIKVQLDRGTSSGIVQATSELPSTLPLPEVEGGSTYLKVRQPLVSLVPSIPSRGLAKLN